MSFDWAATETIIREWAIAKTTVWTPAEIEARAHILMSTGHARNCDCVTDFTTDPEWDGRPCDADSECCSCRLTGAEVQP